MGRIVIEIEGGRIEKYCKQSDTGNQVNVSVRAVMIHVRHHQHPTLLLTDSESQPQTWAKVAYSEDPHSLLKLLSYRMSS